MALKAGEIDAVEVEQPTDADVAEVEDQDIPAEPEAVDADALSEPDAPDEMDEGAAPEPELVDAFDDATLQEAEQLGLSAADVLDKFGSAQDFKRFLSFKSLFGGQQPQPEPENTQPTDKPKAQPEVKLPELDFEFDPDNDDPAKINENLKAFSAHQAEQLKASHARVAEMSKSVQQLTSYVQQLTGRLVSQRVKEADGYLSNLAPVWKKKLGDGPTAKLQKGSAAEANRAKLFKQAGIIEQAAFQRGESLDYAEALDRAMRSLWREEAAKEVREQTKADLRKSEGRTVAPARHRRITASKKDAGFVI